VVVVTNKLRVPPTQPGWTMHMQQEASAEHQ
jgi:hypothetical protein